MIHGETKLTSNFQFDYVREREREKEIIWCTVMWKIGWLILTFYCVGEGHIKNWNLKSLWEINFNDNLMHSYNFIFVKKLGILNEMDFYYSHHFRGLLEVREFTFF